jgi:hypothetical protein
MLEGGPPQSVVNARPQRLTFERPIGRGQPGRNPRSLQSGAARATSILPTPPSAGRHDHRSSLVCNGMIARKKSSCVNFFTLTVCSQC